MILYAIICPNKLSSQHECFKFGKLHLMFLTQVVSARNAVIGVFQRVILHKELFRPLDRIQHWPALWRSELHSLECRVEVTLDAYRIEFITPHCNYTITKCVAANAYKSLPKFKYVWKTSIFTLTTLHSMLFPFFFFLVASLL